MAGVLKMGAKLAFRMGYRVPFLTVAASPCAARTIRCSSDRKEDVFREACKLVPGMMAPLRVMPPPKVAIGWLRIEFCPAAKPASSAAIEALFAWLMAPDEMS